MHLIEYLTRFVHPFVLDESSPEKLPRKLKLKEILYKSDVESSSIKFRKHRIEHHLDESEKYIRRKRNA